MFKNFRRHLTYENIIAGVLFSIIAFILIFPFVIAGAANRQLVNIYHVTELGAPFSELKAKVVTLPQTWISGGFTSDSAHFSAPLQFGAKNWVLRIYAKDQKIACVKICTDDSVNEHPADAPPDKGKWNYRWEDGTWVEQNTEPK